VEIGGDRGRMGGLWGNIALAGLGIAAAWAGISGEGPGRKRVGCPPEGAGCGA
jgi:hypothetical protein